MCGGVWKGAWLELLNWVVLGGTVGCGEGRAWLEVVLYVVGKGGRGTVGCGEGSREHMVLVAYAWMSTGSVMWV